MAKLFKEMATTGQSKFMPAIALGHAQSSVVNLAYFENEILDLPSIMIPPMMSSTISGQEILDMKNQRNASKNENLLEEKSVGRPAKSDDEKSEKTI